MFKNVKKILAATLAAATLLSLTACNGGGKTSSDAQSGTDASGAQSGGVAITATLKVGASPAPHAEILEFVKPQLLEKGIDLQIIEFTDYVIPNDSLEAGELDANYFQHKPYMDKFNAEKGTHLAAAALIHFEPLGIYPGKSKDLKDIKDGAEIAVPNDPTNEARALLLLEAQGIIKLKEGAGLSATPLDIAENPKNIKFIEIEAAQVPKTLPDVDFGVINGNYAMEAGIATTGLAAESSETTFAKEYPNVLAVKEGNENNEAIKALIEAMTSVQTKEFMTKTYGAAVVPLF